MSVCALNMKSFIKINQSNPLTFELTTQVRIDEERELPRILHMSIRMLLRLFTFCDLNDLCGHVVLG